MPENSLWGRIYGCQSLTGLYHFWAQATATQLRNYVFSWSHLAQPYIELEFQFFISGKTFFSYQLCIEEGDI